VASGDDALRVPVTVPKEVVEYIAVRVAELLADQEQTAAEEAAWIDVAAAAHHLGYADGSPRGRQRIYDLVSQRRLRFAKDGSRLLFRRAWLDDYLEGSQTATGT
jgi:excisionase family DNA binding protein